MTPPPLLHALPAKVLQAAQYFGSFVRLNCVAADGGEVEVRIYLADWQLVQDGTALADSEGAASENNHRLATLKSRELLEVAASGDCGVTLSFTGGCAIHLKANLDEYELEDELMLTYTDAALVKFFPQRGFVVSPPVSKVSKASGP